MQPRRKTERRRRQERLSLSLSLWKQCKCLSNPSLCSFSYFLFITCDNCNCCQSRHRICFMSPTHVTNYIIPLSMINHSRPMWWRKSGTLNGTLPCRYMETMQLQLLVSAWQIFHSSLVSQICRITLWAGILSLRIPKSSKVFLCHKLSTK